MTSGNGAVARVSVASGETRGLARLRRHNSERILAYVAETGGATRAQIARGLSVSPSTATVLVGALLSQGRLQERPAELRGDDRGRPGRMLTLAGPSRACMAAELDHAALRLAVSRTGDRESLLRREVAVEGIEEPARVLARLAQECAQAIEDAGLSRRDVDRLVLGVPAPVHPDTGVVGASLVLTEWRGLPVAAQLARLLGIRVDVENDANLAVLAEVDHAQTPDARGVMFVKASAGLGSSLYLNGQVHRGARGAAGELGHVRVPGASKRCRCGEIGCLETMTSTTALRDELAARGIGPRRLSIHEVATRVADGDERISAVLRRMGTDLGVVISTVCTVVDLDRVVIGGELPGLCVSFVDGVIDAIDARLNRSLTGRLRVEQSGLGPWAVVDGGLLAGRVRDR